MLLCGLVCLSADETPPTIVKCPVSGFKYVDTENQNDEKREKNPNVTAADGKTIATNKVTPTTYTLSKNTLNDVITLKQEVVDNQGFKAECTFQYVIKGKFNACLLNGYFPPEFHSDAHLNIGPQLFHFLLMIPPYCGINVLSPLSYFSLPPLPPNPTKSLFPSAHCSTSPTLPTVCVCRLSLLTSSIHSTCLS